VKKTNNFSFEEEKVNTDTKNENQHLQGQGNEFEKIHKQSTGERSGFMFEIVKAGMAGVKT